MPTKKYAHAQEIFEYAQRLGRHFDMYPHALFHTEVTGMEWDEDAKRWMVPTDRGDQLDGALRRHLRRRAAQGEAAGHPRHRDLPGHVVPHQPLGLRLHRRRPRGADGQAARQEGRHHRHRRHRHPGRAEAGRGGEQLYVFQRTPSSVSPRNQRDTDPEWFAEMSSKPGWHEERMANFIDMTTGANPRGRPHPGRLDRDVRGRREEGRRETRRRPPSSSSSTSSSWTPCASGSPTPCEDPATAEALKPWYGVSCKRPCYHDDYLPAFNRDNVTLVDTDGLGVTAITENGIIVGDTEYDGRLHRLRHRLRLAEHLLHAPPRLRPDRQERRVAVRGVGARARGRCTAS